ncbi:MAG: hypothetical protein ABR998_06660 [Gemmatimonadales bacterium]
MDAKIQAVKSDVLRWMFLLWIGTVVLTVALRVRVHMLPVSHQGTVAGHVRNVP